MEKTCAQEQHHIGDLLIDARRIALYIESRKGASFVMRVFSTSGSSWLGATGVRSSSTKALT